MKAKRTAARRRKHEKQTPARSPADPSNELSWREVRTLLDEEIAALPDMYRSVFVLCCLENLSRAEAAQRLSLKERTVGSRLAEAKKRLSQRLARRGVELTAVLAATALVTPPVSALPARLIAKTLKAVLAAASGKELASVVSAAVVELVQDATTALVGSKAKIAMVMLLAASLLTSANVSTCRTLEALQLSQAEPAKTPSVATKKIQKSQENNHKDLTVSGRVVDPDGKPDERSG
jgi:hypothetical protein